MDDHDRGDLCNDHRCNNVVEKLFLRSIEDMRRSSRDEYVVGECFRRLQLQEHVALVDNKNFFALDSNDRTTQEG